MTVDELNAESQDDTGSNGWQGDSWTTFKYKGRLFVLVTTAFYGEIKLEARAKTP